MTYDPEVRRVTPLATKLMERITREGPISVAEFMRTALQDPEHGYYRTRHAIGRTGDFVTAPEISQTFGELIGLWSAVVWQEMGAPGHLALIELGPGRGTLMRDALRALKVVPQLRDTLAVHLVESNHALRDEQQKTLAGIVHDIAWHETAATIPEGPAIVIANEFLDTLPMSQFVSEAEGWVERGVGLAGGGFAFCPLPIQSQTAARIQFPKLAYGSIVEIQDFAEIVALLRDRARTAPLAALFIDYGYDVTSPGETLQAVRNHQAEHPLSSPGEADLTVHVDFAAFARAARVAGLALDGPVPQAEFLGSLGIMERASRLMSANPEKAAAIEAGVVRLMAHPGMGSRFKAIGLRAPSLPPLPGLAAMDRARPAP